MADTSQSVLDEQDLDGMSKKAASIILNVETETKAEFGLKDLSGILNDVLKAADAPQIGVKHRVVACNTLCKVLEQCISSKHQPVQCIVCDANVSRRLIDLYVGRYDHVKAKAMKQVLNTLIRLLKTSDTLQSSPRPSIIALQRFGQILAHEDDRLKAKPALHALSFMINKKLLQTSEIILHFQRGQQGSQTGLEFSNKGSTLGDLQNLLRIVLDWVKHSDVAATAGQFLTTFLSKHDLRDQRERSGSNKTSLSLPVWAEPLLRSIKEDPGALSAFKTYAFSSLFQLDASGFWAFILNLGVEDYLALPHETSFAEEMEYIPGGQREEVLFAALQTEASEVLMRVELPNQNSMFLSDNIIVISDVLVGKLLIHSSHVARIAGLTLLVSSQQMTIPLTEHSFIVLKRNIPLLYADTDPNFRGEVQGLIQSLVDRIRAVTFNITAKLKRQETSKEPLISLDASSENLKQSLSNHKLFLEWFIGFLTSELHVCASYQRHISALKSMRVLLRSGLDPSAPMDSLAKQARGDIHWPFKLSVLTAESQRHLFDLLLDAFDDVRQASLSILQTQLNGANADADGRLITEISRSQLAGTQNIQRSLKRATGLMMQTGRVDHADGVARLCDLECYVTSHSEIKTSEDVVKAVTCNASRPTFDSIEDLVNNTEAAVDLARTHLYAAVGKAPVHGLFTSLRYTVIYLKYLPDDKDLRERRVNLVRRMLECVSSIWKSVQHLLCNDAPEGYMPEDAEGEGDMTTKDIYSYSWRALKDSSLLLREVIASGIDDLLQIDAEPKQTYKEVGDLCFQQLAELRHRGAFSTVSQTFFVICQHCVRHKDGEVRGLVEAWYSETKGLIQQHGSTITRRSAGIPALIVSLLAADPESSLFDNAILELQSLALLPVDETKPEDLPQVHALNSLKAIFTSTRLASQSERHVTSSVEVAARCLGSTIWAIRNCGLMLFRGLFDRLLGSDQKLTSSTKQASQVAPLRWESYPGLLDLLVGMLQRGHATSLQEKSEIGEMHDSLEAETIFPAIDIFRRARPPQEKLHIVHGVVKVALRNPHWHVRVIASRADAALQDQSQAYDTSRLQNVTDNELHGEILTWRHRARSSLQSNDAENFTLLQEALVDILGILKKRVPSTPILAAFADSLIELGILCLRQSKSASVSDSAKGTDLSITATQSSILRYSTLVEYFAELARPRFGKRTNALAERATILAVLIGEIVQDTSSTELTGDQTARRQKITSLLKAGDNDITLWVLDCLEESFGDTRAYCSEVLVLALLDLMNDSDQPLEIKAASCGVLAASLSGRSTNQSWTESSNIIQPLSQQNFGAMFWSTTTPSEMENILQVWGFSIDAKFLIQQTWSAGLVSELLDFVKICQSALDEENEFPLRFAAVSALNGLNAVLKPRTLIAAEPEIALLFTTYKGCVDDDEEVRGTAAKAARNILQTHRVSGHPLPQLSPPIACQMICQHLIKYHAASKLVLEGALRNFFGQNFPNLNTFENGLQEALYRDTSLFATEKQNLYIDPVKEAQTWATVLKRLGVSTLSTDVVRKYAEWTLSGLELLTAKSKSETDGALGWTSKPEVFVLGLQVIFAAEVLLTWRASTTKVTVRGSTIRDLLAKFVESGKQAELHEAWLRHAQQVFEQSITKQLKRVHDVLAVIQ